MCDDDDVIVHLLPLPASELPPIEECVGGYRCSTVRMRWPRDHLGFQGLPWIILDNMRYQNQGLPRIPTKDTKYYQPRPTKLRDHRPEMTRWKKQERAREALEQLHCSDWHGRQECRWRCPSPPRWTRCRCSCRPAPPPPCKIFNWTIFGFRCLTLTSPLLIHNHD